jgi:TfoX/Sxy family transcriptional regulator of competence genes
LPGFGIEHDKYNKYRSSLSLHNLPDAVAEKQLEVLMVAKPGRMPKFEPAPEAVVNLFKTNGAGLPELELRKMFGYPCAFVSGQMLTGIFGERIMLRLSETDRARFLQLPGAKAFEPMDGRPMREYVELPTHIMNSPEQFKYWLQCGYEYVKTLPPKARKSRRARPD